MLRRKSSKQLRDDLMTLLIAGHETTAAVLDVDHALPGRRTHSTWPGCRQRWAPFTTSHLLAGQLSWVPR